MYVCNCNGLREHCVRQAIAAGAETPQQIYAHHGCQAQCGQCQPDMLAMLRQAEGGTFWPTATPTPALASA
ncbi:MAG: hypothetical protein EBQ89_09160 [Alphaproteobacteria bacterium]|nr:hypothetical protein [Alphaproteobacteria bacterium]